MTAPATVDPRTAVAEVSPDATRDGRVAGSAIGVITADRRTRWTPLVQPDGQPFATKVEGLLAADVADRVLVVVDADDPDAASEVRAAELRGGWRE